MISKARLYQGADKESVKYTVIEDVFINGMFYAVGNAVELTPRDAKYYLPPLANVLELADERRVRSPSLSAYKRRRGMSQVSAKMRRGVGRYFHWCPGCQKMHPLLMAGRLTATWMLRHSRRVSSTTGLTATSVTTS